MNLSKYCKSNPHVTIKGAKVIVNKHHFAELTDEELDLLDCEFERRSYINLDTVMEVGIERTALQRKVFGY